MKQTTFSKVANKAVVARSAAKRSSVVVKAQSDAMVSPGSLLNSTIRWWEENEALDLCGLLNGPGKRDGETLGEKGRTPQGRDLLSLIFSRSPGQMFRLWI
jgi:hypothetical protein